MNLFLIQSNWYIINFRDGGLYIDSRDGATINLKNKDNKCFQYAVMVALNYRETESHPEIVSNVKPFINKYKWKGLNYP